MKVTGIKTSLVHKNTDLFSFLDKELTHIEERTIIAISSKIIALSEGRVISKTQNITKEKLIEQESDLYIDSDYSKYGFHMTITKNILIASAGIDESNADGENFVLWPKNPQNSAVTIWNHLRKRHNCKNIGVIITDSKLSPLRWGVTGIAISYCGFAPLNDFRGKPDAFGKPLRVTQVNVADGLAAAAALIMGESNEQMPIAKIQDVPFVTFQDSAPSEKDLQELIINKEDDLYAPLINSSLWKKGKQED